MVAEKPDPTVCRICFCSIFQTVMNLGKMTKEMSSEGPKMVGERYGSAWNGRKMAKSGYQRWWLSPCSPARSGHVRWRLAVKFHGDGCLVGTLLPVLHVYSDGSLNHLRRLKPEWPENGSKRPNSTSTGFEGIFLGFLGLGTLLARKNMLI